MICDAMVLVFDPDSDRRRHEPDSISIFPYSVIASNALFELLWADISGSRL